MSSVIHRPSREGSAQRRTTSSKAVSTRTSKRASAWRSERRTRSAPAGMTPRGSGDHQPVVPLPVRAQPHGEQARAGRPRAASGLEVGARGDEVLAGLGPRRVEQPRRARGLDGWVDHGGAGLRSVARSARAGRSPRRPSSP